MRFLLLLFGFLFFVFYLAYGAPTELLALWLHCCTHSKFELLKSEKITKITETTAIATKTNINCIRSVRFLKESENPALTERSVSVKRKVRRLMAAQRAAP